MSFLDNIPKLFGSRIRIKNEELPQYIKERSYSNEEKELTGHSYIGTLTLVPNYKLHRAFSMCEDFSIRPTELIVNNDQDIEITIIVGGSVWSRFSFLPGTNSINFDDKWISENYDFYIDLHNLSNIEVNISCQFAFHCLQRPGMMIRDNWNIAHVETDEEIQVREASQREAIQRRAEGEERSWTELNATIGRRATDALKFNKPILFTGSNGDQYSINGNGDLSNVSKGRRYCVVLNSTEPLPVADVIMEKMKWVMHDAEEVERVKNDIGEINLLEEIDSLITV